jgi:hypothetical protein
MDFGKKSYSPQDLLEAKIKVRRVDAGKLPSGTSVRVLNNLGISVVDKLLLDSFGEGSVNYKIP